MKRGNLDLSAAKVKFKGSLQRGDVLDLQKAANVSQILSLLPGAYCAYGTWMVLHPKAEPGLFMNPISMATAFGAFAALLTTGLVLRFVSVPRKPAASPGVDQAPISLPVDEAPVEAPRVVFEYQGQAISSKIHQAIRVIPFILRNAGRSDAFNVIVHEIRNGDYATRAIEIGCIAQDSAPTTVEPIVERNGRAIMLNGMPELVKALEKSDVTDAEVLVTAKRAIQVTITYVDFKGIEYESVFELVHTYLGEKTSVRFVSYRQNVKR